MIRRENAQQWLIIPQIAHAQLAAEIADCWWFDSVTIEADEISLMKQAVHHHDDGWQVWDSAPRIDPATGIPRDFREMPAPAATEIWRKSIDECVQQIDPLVGVWVSRHFCALAVRALSSREVNDDQRALHMFLSEQEKFQGECCAASQKRLDHKRDPDRLIEFGYRVVQFFDLVSLWLCCSESPAPLETTSPAGQSVQLSPLTDNRVDVSAKLLRSEELHLATTGFPIAARPYHDDQELYDAISEATPATIRWTLRCSADEA